MKTFDTNIDDIIEEFIDINIPKLAEFLKDVVEVDLDGALDIVIKQCKPGRIPLLARELSEVGVDIRSMSDKFIERCHGSEIPNLAIELAEAGVDIEDKSDMLIKYCRSFDIDDLVYELKNAGVNIESRLGSIIGSSNESHTYRLLQKLREMNIDVREYANEFLEKCNNYNIFNMTRDLIGIGADVKGKIDVIIKKCVGSHIPDLVAEFSKAGVDIISNVEMLIQKCIETLIPELVFELMKDGVDVKNYADTLVKRCKEYNIIELASYLKDAGVDIENDINVDNKNKIESGIKNLLKQPEIMEARELLELVLKNEAYGVDMHHKIKSLREKLIVKKETLNVGESIQNYKMSENIFLDNKTIQGLYEIVKQQKANFYMQLGLDITKRRQIVNKNISSDIRQGIEIETIGMIKSNVLTKKFSEKEDITLANYDKQLDKKLCGKYNTEIVSEKLNPNNEEDTLAIYEVCDKLNRNLARTNYTCGLHIHISNTMIAEISNKLANKIELNSEEIKFLNDIYKDMMFFQYILVEELNIYGNRVEKQAGFLPTNITGIDFVNRAVEKFAMKDNFERYYILNMQSLMKHGTLEFRLFNLPDAVDENVLLAYSDFTASLVSYVSERGSISEKIKSIFEGIESEIDGVSKKNINICIYEELLNQIVVTEETNIILRNLDNVFDFYGAKEPEIKKNKNNYKRINYYDNQEIHDVEEIEDGLIIAV